jgi:hypothetical protein
MLHIHHDDIILDKLPSLAEEFMLLLLFLGTAMLPFLVVLNLTLVYSFLYMRNWRLI